MKKQKERSSSYFHKHHFEAGMSLPELSAILAITGILAAISLPSISLGGNALSDSGQRLVSTLKLTRARSMSQTSAYKISPASANKLKVEYSTSCTASTWTNARGWLDTDLDLDEGVTFSSASEDGAVVSDPGQDWSVCFDSRGYANKTLKLTLFDTKKSKTQQLQIFRGGTVSIL